METAELVDMAETARWIPKQYLSAFFKNRLEVKSQAKDLKFNTHSWVLCRNTEQTSHEASVPRKMKCGCTRESF